MVPVARTTYDMEQAEDVYHRGEKLLKELCPQAEVASSMLTEPEALISYLDDVLSRTNIDLVLLQNTTMTDARFMVELARRIKCPVLIWSLRDSKPDGGRLRLNSLTGGFTAGNVFSNLGHRFVFLYGDPKEKQLQKRLKDYLYTANMLKQLESLKVGVIGNFPPGFYFSEELDLELLSKVGTVLHRYNYLEIIEEARQLKEEEYAPVLKKMNQTMCHLSSIARDTVEKSARLKTAIQKHVEKDKLGALAIHCWPTIFNYYGTAACGVISMFTDEGIVASCEADIGGAISMFMLREASGGIPYLGDPVYLDENKNSIIFWYCGAGACSLARKGKGSCAGVHPNRGIGPTMEFGLKPGRVTICRFGKSRNGYRIFITNGEALDEPQKYPGTSIEVRLDNNAAAVVENLVNEGWEPHYALVHEDVAFRLNTAAEWLDLEVHYL